MENYLQYNDPVRIEWRTGQVGDEYVKIIDTYKIVNNRIVLSEIPDEEYRVMIENFYETSDLELPKENTYSVNYRNGIISFHPSQEGKTVNAEYMGRGIILYPANRIYVHNRTTDVERNLQNIVDNSQRAINIMDEFNEFANNISEKGKYAQEQGDIAKIKSETAEKQGILTKQQGEYAERQGNESKKQGDYAKSQGDYAKEKGDFSQLNGEYAQEQGAYAKEQGDFAQEQGDYARNQGVEAKDHIERFKFKGDYDTNERYDENNIVHYEGASFICIKSVTGQAPSWKDDDNHWRVFSKSQVVSVNGKSDIVNLDAEDVDAPSTMEFNELQNKVKEVENRTNNIEEEMLSKNGGVISGKLDVSGTVKADSFYTYRESGTSSTSTLTIQIPQSKLGGASKTILMTVRVKEMGVVTTGTYLISTGQRNGCVVNQLQYSYWNSDHSISVAAMTNFTSIGEDDLARGVKLQFGGTMPTTPWNWTYTIMEIGSLEVI
ncbi:hypothetical protein B7C51_25275 (plasmid) [Paenibacillus larvae subsp. pulvifaciens]|uniref:Uncharacterized protein n=1 Tax=Paenibacillus larvae subsp. pulvifaciens TaxID=1477 RepID=A0A1V0UZY3_9BACL|nr:hypothetical protein [Paenibacillus larvae]ARF70785.1 hypothetical protein B7C51_25275 [Paenibacillus larvae subsp. pulvifaciens]